MSSSSPPLRVRALSASLVLLVGLTASSLARAQTPAPSDPAAAWRNGDPIPAGYRRTLRPRRDLLSIGAALFVLPYVASALDATTAYSPDSNTYSSRTIMWVPGAGPFIMMGSTSSAGGNVLLLLDGLAQVAGLSTFIYGLATPSARIILDQPEKAGSLTFTPLLTRGMTGAALIGRF